MGLIRELSDIELVLLNKGDHVVLQYSNRRFHQGKEKPKKTVYGTFVTAGDDPKLTGKRARYSKTCNMLNLIHLILDDRRELPISIDAGREQPEELLAFLQKQRKLPGTKEYPINDFDNPAKVYRIMDE